MAKKLDITGQKFGRLTAIAVSHSKNNYTYWKCICSCGSEVTVIVASLRCGQTKSCGCLQKEIIGSMRRKHGKSNTSIYTIWEDMHSRCFNSADPRFYKYGAVGISVCSRWLDFQNFYNDMGDRPADKTLDRMDNFSNYSPYNCRWATNSEQQRNTNAKGYHWDKEKKKWAASISIGRRCIHLGRFDTEEEARNAYLEAKHYYHPMGDMRPEYTKRLHRCWGRL